MNKTNTNKMHILIFLICRLCSIKWQADYLMGCILFSVEGNAEFLRVAMKVILFSFSGVWECQSAFSRPPFSLLPCSEVEPLSLMLPWTLWHTMDAALLCSEDVLQLEVSNIIKKWQKALLLAKRECNGRKWKAQSANSDECHRRIGFTVAWCVSSQSS